MVKMSLVRRDMRTMKEKVVVQDQDASEDAEFADFLGGSKAAILDGLLAEFWL